MMRIALLVLVCAIGTMSWLADLVQPGYPRAFVLAGVVAGVGYFVALRRSWSAGGVLGVSLGLRLLMLPAEPGDDYWRYRWEGRVQAAGFNPYVSGPHAPELESLQDAAWAKVNHTEFAAAYPPGAELLFRSFARHGTWIWKSMLLAADLAIVALLLRLGGTAAAAAFGWNPLVVFSSAGAGHFDVWMVLPLVGAVFVLERALRTHRLIEFALSVVLLGIAIAIKFAPLVLLPVWCFAMGWRRAWLLPLAFLPLGAAAWLFGWPQVDIFESFREFARVARTNDCIWWLSERFFWPNAGQKNEVYQLITALGCGISALACGRDWQRGLRWVLGALLILNPALHPWYLVWIIPFAALAGRAGRAWLVFSSSIFGYFLLWEQPVPWEQPAWQRLLILLPPLIAVAWVTLHRQDGAGPVAPLPA